MNATSPTMAASSSHRLALSPGFMLDGCRIESVLGKGGFGLTYLATDTTLNFKVAIKELLPDGIATRVQGATVVAQTAELTEAWSWALKRFEEEARILAQLRHPNIVRVLRLIRAHGTVYMVMEYVEGMSVDQWLRKFPHPSEGSLRSLLTPLLDGLDHVHQKRLLHRDISPDNIVITNDGRPILLDFGSARQDLGKTTSVTAVVRHGFSPFEQYQVKSHQGPYTDLYALAGVMAMAMTGQKPPPATDRLSNDGQFPPLAMQTRGRYSEAFCQAIDCAFSVRPQDRPQTVAQFQQMLNGQGLPQRPMGGMPGMPADHSRTVPLAQGANYSQRLTPLPMGGSGGTVPLPVYGHGQGQTAGKGSSMGWMAAGVMALALVGTVTWWLAVEKPGPQTDDAGKLASQSTEIHTLTQQLADAKNNLDRANGAKSSAEDRASRAETESSRLAREKAALERQLASGNRGGNSTNTTANASPALLHSFGTTTAQGLFSTYMSLAELGDLFAAKSYDTAKVTQVATGFKNMTATAKTSLTTLAGAGALDSADTEFSRQAASANGELSEMAQALIDVAGYDSPANRAAFETIRKKCWKSISVLLGIDK